MANEVRINVNANTAGAENRLAAVGQKLAGVGRAATIAGGAILAIGVGSVTTFAKMGDEVQKMALRTGFSTEALSEFRIAADLSGGSLQGLENGIRRMQRTVVDAGDGMLEAVDALDRMGVSVEELEGQTPEKQFEILTNALAEMQDPTTQAATAMEIFGRAGTSLLPMLAGGADGLAAMKQQAHDMGVVFDQEAADKAAAFNDSLTTLKASMQGVMMTIGEQLAPHLTAFAEATAKVIARVSEWADANPTLAKILVVVSMAIGGILAVLGPLLMMLPGIIAIAPLVGAAFHVMLGPIGLITGAIALVIAAVFALKKAWEENLFGIQDITKKIWEKVAGFIGKAIDWIVEKLNKMIDGVNAVGGIFGKQIPPIEEIGDAILDLGRKVRNTAKDFLGLGDATEASRSRLHTVGMFGGGAELLEMRPPPSTTMPTMGGGGMGGAGRLAGAMTPEQRAKAEIFAMQLNFLTNPQAQIGALSHEQITGGLRRIGLSDRMPASFTVDNFGQATLEYPMLTWQQISMLEGEG